MSADSIDRRGLERKDRAELATIVQTLGGKPSSRARKAELVDMILQLAGVADAPGDAGQGGDATDAGPADAGSTEPSATDTDESGSETPEESAAAGEPAEGRSAKGSTGTKGSSRPKDVKQTKGASSDDVSPVMARTMTELMPLTSPRVLVEVDPMTATTRTTETV